MEKTYAPSTINKAIEWYHKLNSTDKITNLEISEIVELYLKYKETDKPLIFNINDCVRVKLTESGLKTWEERFNKYQPKNDPYTFEKHLESKTDTEGYVSFQLHDLMSIFGPQMYIGNENSFINNQILFDKEDFK
jgi:hypothetical protein